MTHLVAGENAGEPHPHLQVCLLGPPCVRYQEAPVVIPRRQARALLFRLATSLEPIGRESLACLFWPEAPESEARRNLSRLVALLRRALPDASLLLAQEDALALDASRCVSDTACLERAWQDWQTRPEPAALQAAVDAARGPFLDGFSLAGEAGFDTWAAHERSRWERCRLEALAALAGAYAAAGRLPEAIACARRRLALDDLSEEAYRCLFALHARTGERAQVQRLYEQCVLVLERELGVAPLPETQAAYQAALAGAAPRPVDQPATPVWVADSFEFPFVGRADVLDELNRLANQARRGAGVIALVDGEPGIGKSRLVAEFLAGLPPPVGVLSATCEPASQAQPFQPVMEALLPALRQHPGTLHSHILALAEVSRLSVELRSLYPHLPAPPPVAPEQVRLRLFEALASLTLALAMQSAGLVLCLDDLQWADQASLDWLAYLGRRMQNAALLVIGAYRSTEADHLSELRRSLEKHHRLAELHLSGLDELAVSRLIAGLGERLPGEVALARRLHQASAGNPFFVVETLRSCLEAGPPPQGWQAQAPLPLPETVRQAVAGRLERLSPLARQVLEAGAALGQGFQFEVLRLVAGRGELEMMDALAELLDRRLLQEQPGGFDFRHEIVAAVVDQAMGGWRSRLLHRRAAEALEQLGAVAPAELARHYEAAGCPSQAAAYLLQAGQAAKAVFARRDALACFDRALALLTEESLDLQAPAALSANRRLRLQALEERSWALRLLGEMDQLAVDLEQETDLTAALGDSNSLAHLYWRQAWAHNWFCRYPAACEAARLGVDLSQLAGDRQVEAGCWRELGLALRARGDYAPARQHLLQALELFESLGQTQLAVHTRSNLATLLDLTGEHAASLALSRENLRACDQAGLSFERRLPLGDIGAAAAALGRPDLARPSLLESLAIAERINDRTQEIFCHGHLGWLALTAGEAAAATHLQAALDLAQAIGSLAEQSWLLRGLARCAWQSGDVQAARHWAGQAAELAGRLGQAPEQRAAASLLADFSAHPGV